MFKVKQAKYWNNHCLHRWSSEMYSVPVMSSPLIRSYVTHLLFFLNVKLSHETQKATDNRKALQATTFFTLSIFVSSGSGVALISNFEQLLRGVWRPETNEILSMSLWVCLNVWCSNAVRSSRPRTAGHQNPETEQTNKYDKYNQHDKYDHSQTQTTVDVFESHKFGEGATVCCISWCWRPLVAASKRGPLLHKNVRWKCLHPPQKEFLLC